MPTCLKNMIPIIDNHVFMPNKRRCMLETKRKYTKYGTPEQSYCECPLNSVIMQKTIIGRFFSKMKIPQYQVTTLRD